MPSNRGLDIRVPIGPFPVKTGELVMWSAGCRAFSSGLNPIGSMSFYQLKLFIRIHPYMILSLRE